MKVQNKYIFNCVTLDNEQIPIIISAKDLTKAVEKFNKNYSVKKVLSVKEKGKPKLSLFNEKAFMELSYLEV